MTSRKLRPAADSGDGRAMVEAADLLASGEAGKVDRQESFIYLIRAMLRGEQVAQPQAAEVRSEMSDKEWQKTREEIKRRFRFFGDAAKLDAALQSVQPSSMPK